MTVRALTLGMAAGVAGVAAMTLGEKVEQIFTHRPNSYMPAHTLERLVGLPDADRTDLNWAMHWGQGILLGAVRGLMAERGVRGPAGSFLFLNLRLLNDQTLENATGAGSPPWTWPVDEQVIDISHKAVYAAVTGMVADRLIAGPPNVPRPMEPWLERPRPGEQPSFGELTGNGSREAIRVESGNERSAGEVPDVASPS